MSNSFVARFESVASQLRRVQSGQRLAQAGLLLLAAIGALAAADYAFELPWTVRATGFGLACGAAFLMAVAGLVSVWRKWTRPQTAVVIEEQFPELGQRVRTVVQFTRPSGTVVADGVAPTLAEALHEDTTTRAEPLPLSLIVPSRRLLVMAGAALAVVATFVVLSATQPDWRVAFQRAMLGREPWTKLSVAPGNAVVREGATLKVSLALEGRTNRPVTLLWRVAGDPNAAWTEHAFKMPETAARKVTYEQPLEKIRKPLEYRVIAGAIQSPTYQVGVRFPLKMTGVNVELTPPKYTGLKPSTQKDPNINGLAGTKVKLKIDLDRAPDRARLVVRAAQEAKKGEPPVKSKDVPLSIQGKTLSADLVLSEDQTYSIVATSADGMELAENKHRIRVRPDQAPTVWFEDPPEALEVHSLVEVLMKIRARDDFGLAKAGIKFQINNEEEHTLLLEDFAALLKGDKSPQTQALLEKLLPLEHFELTQKDSVTYYAFAEDNFPDAPHRAETDLRFVDIRPFRRTYQIFDPTEMSGMPGRQLASLEELIARQRYALNQTIRMAKRPDAARADIAALDKLVAFEGKLATATHDLADFLTAREVDGADLLYQAEDSMLASVDSLQVGKFENATLQERDALRYLIEGRDKVQISLSKKPQAVRDAVQQFSRTQAQKLRRPKDDAETAAEVVEQIRQLAAKEEIVYETLAGIRMDAPASKMPPTKSKGTGGSGMPDDKDPMKTEGQTGEKGEKPMPGDKGEKPGEGDKGEKPMNKGNGDNPGKKGNGEGDKDEGGAGPTREEIAKKQQEITEGAYDVQKALQKLQGISDLAKERMANSLKGSEAVKGALDRGQTEEAAKEAGKTAGTLRELAKNVEGLVAQETAEQVAMARQLADELSVGEREVADELKQPMGAGTKPGEKPQAGAGKEPAKEKKPGAGEGQEPGEKGNGKEPSKEKKPGNGAGTEPGEKGTGGAGKGEKTDTPGTGAGEGELEKKAAELAETGRTLEDILKAIAKSNEPADQKAVEGIGKLLDEGKLKDTIDKMQGIGGKIEKGEKKDAGLSADDVADNLDAAARNLEDLHRQIVAPRVADLMKLEEAATKLAGDLDELETENQITGWHRDAETLMDELEDAEVEIKEIDDLREAMKGEGWNLQKNAAGGWNWVRNNGKFGAPGLYNRVTRKLVKELQSRIQELVLKEMIASGDEASPPEFARQIEKYYEVLSSELGKK